MEKIEINDVINRLFVNTDLRTWETVEACFADSVNLDYTSLVGGEPLQVTPSQIMVGWKSLLPGFQATHHQVSNFLIDLDGNEAACSANGIAYHYLPNQEGENFWTVVGTYDFQLAKQGQDWKVTMMKFNFKFMMGNPHLPEMAQNIVAKEE